MAFGSKLHKEVFICLDCEATGLEIESEEIIEIAVVKFTFDEILEQYEALVDRSHQNRHLFIISPMKWLKESQKLRKFCQRFSK